MDIQKSSFSSLPRSQYLELLPHFRKERTQEVTTLILTIVTVCFFGFFAISPTLSIIANLKRQLADNHFVSNKLQEKITNLRTLQEKYSVLQNDIPVVFSAIPDHPQVPYLLAQIQSLVIGYRIQLIHMRASQADLSPNAPAAISKTATTNPYSTFSFSLEATGPYGNVTSFITGLGNFDRIITINSIVIKKDAEANKPVHVIIAGDAYFKK